MTQITRKSVPMRGLILLLTVTLGAGLVLVGCGDDDTATTPAPTPPAPPPPPPDPDPDPAPEPPATPTGLMVSATTETSITWTWNAVEGAIGYAVQTSGDETFDDTDTIHPTAETTFTASDLLPETSVFVRVAAAGGTLEAPLLSTWTTHVTGMSAMPPPPPPAPEAPATPTGLTATSGEGFVEWSWDAVEGASGYAVQVSADEMFTDEDIVTHTTETSHRMEDLDYSTTLYARVASTGGTEEAPLLSAWTTHTTAMSTAEPPPPPPPAPDPVMVTFSLSEDAESSHFMRADGDDDVITAKASVNSEIMVSSNTVAIITPMFVDGANGVSVDDGDNMPFARVSWSMLQSAVLSDGATFMVQRATIGANQEMEPSGDVAYVTCGPFNCADGMDVPEISITDSGVCSGWDPDLTLQVGRIDNDVLESTLTSTDVADDGLDAGWVTSSSVEMSVTHHFSGVANGENYKVSGRDSAKGSDKALPMDLGDGIADSAPEAAADDDPDTSNADYLDGLLVSAKDTDGDESVCETYSDRNIRGGLDKPDNCFRIVGDPDYLGGYTVETSAKGSAVTWGSVEWEDDPFEDLTCDSMTFVTMAQVDVCALFDTEVDQALGEGWLDPTFTYSGTDGTDTIMVELQAEVDGASPYRFSTLWFDHDLDGKIKKDPMHDLYDQNSADGVAIGNNVVGGALQANQTHIQIAMIDADDDPDVDDFGKVDILDNSLEAADTGYSNFDPDGKADNFATDGYADVAACSEGDGGDDADDTICDSIWTDEIEVAFESGTYGCSTTRSFTLTCEWDASGEVDESRRDDDQDDAVVLSATNIGLFASCEIK